MQAEQPIGVFDSGVGGLSILRALRAELPRERFVYYSDAGHAPYGERGDAFVAERTLGIVRELLDEHRVKAVVLACNTATAAAVHLLRERHADVPLIGVEPALKPAAALTRTKRVAVIGTRVTVTSAKFRALHESLQDQAEFLVQPCDGLAGAIETFNDDEIADLCRLYLGSLGEYGQGEGQIDTVVLGCTHYPFASQQIEAVVGPSVRLVENGEPVARHARRVLESRGALSDSGDGQVEFRTTGSDEALRTATSRWLGI